MSKSRSRARTLRKSVVGLDQLGSMCKAEDKIAAIFEAKRYLSVSNHRVITLKERLNRSAAQTKKRKPSLPVLNLPPVVD